MKKHLLICECLIIALKYLTYEQRRNDSNCIMLCIYTANYYGNGWIWFIRSQLKCSSWQNRFNNTYHLLVCNSIKPCGNISLKCRNEIQHVFFLLIWWTISVQQLQYSPWKKKWLTITFDLEQHLFKENIGAYMSMYNKYSTMK